MIDSLQIEEAHAEAIIELAIEAELYEGEMPDSKADKLEAAHDLIGFSIDSWVDDEVTPDHEDEDVAEAGEVLSKMFEIAGVEIDDEGEVTYGEPAEIEDESEDEPEETEADEESEITVDDLEEMDLDELSELAENNDLEVDDIVGKSKGTRAEKKLRDALAELIEGGDESDDDDDDNDGDDEAPFEVNDIIEDWDSIKKAADAVEALNEVVDGEGLYKKQVEELLEHENERSRPRKAVVEALEELLSDADDDDDDADDEPEAEGDGDESDEPWDGYDKAAVRDIKEVLNDDERTVDEIEYVLEYEEARDKPRAQVISTAKKRIAELSKDDNDADDEDAEEKPKRGRGRTKAKVKSDDDHEDLDSQADDAVARDDEKDKRKSRSSKKSKAKAVSDDDFDPDDDEIEEMLPTGLARAFVNDRLHDAQLAKAGLMAPPDWEGDMPDLPDDVASVDHDELSNLLFTFQAAFSTSLWQSSMAYIDADVYEEIADHLENVAILESDESNDTKRKADAKTDMRVVFFRSLAKTNYRSYVRYRDLARTIEGKIKVVSRVGGFKGDDDDGSDRSASKKSTRGTAKGTSAGTTKKRTLRK